MSVVINTNFAATSAANNLAASNANLQKSLNRLSSGSKIVTPADDAGGLAVSMKLTSEAKIMGAQATNLANEVSFFQTQDGALKVAGKVLDRMSELSTLHQDATKSSSDIANYATEFTSLVAQLGTIKAWTFNGLKLFDDVAPALGTAKASTAFGGIVAGDISTQATIQTAITATAALRATNGSDQSTRGFNSELLTVTKANLEAANSRIADVDVAEESTQLARWNILVQSGTSMLAQANSATQSVLKLLQ
jgi:flagellin